MTEPRTLVLVVEDEPQMRRFIRATLTSHGYRLLEAGTAAEALTLATTHNPELVLLDLGLPDGDGIENGVENFFGTHPGTFTQGLIAGSKSGNTFIFTHPQNASPATDLSASYRWSTDLTTFHLGGATSGGTTVTFTAEQNTPSPGFTRVTATATGTIPARLFVDVMVTGP